ncbi:hybrid sensor histidine kinase/response regulator [Sphaerospermopsis reniformis]|uniref:histidine kinase n=1 Tax=Sphaerospermopsis reniformis TaxID=531300 RepID=A0A480A332_9CYAN|nr:hybrid sensor histidine kinase/response regulator [Sphaerospermopsis reniformis]MBD2132432.1 hybrid sensor histidine kinase/response regulator [Sphaerospermopsis sp. FACHB-1094]MBD2145257.1 hybrid sensor histidine kinase/response regulator [Sphaerospermopsis sp. FACHB-1194]GCL36594.1 response regulator receiver sensor signal transduction histidine kinase [Sphaerospermopsis reniformis]
MKILTNHSTILVVDDNPINLKLLDYTLSAAGYNVKMEANGLNVIQKVDDIMPNLILLDIMLPDISGFEICEQLQADPRTQSIPIIFMTALADTMDKVKGLSLGAVDYITKPFQKEELLARVRTHLHLQSLITSLERQNQELRQLTQRNEDLEQRVAERTAELQAALEKEKELSQLKSRFITMASHEFRTPLAIISSSSGILQKFSDRLSAERKEQHFQTIQNTIKHITQILDDVLMINRAESEKIELHLEASDIIAFCRHLKEEIETTSNQHTINFYLDLGEEIMENYLIIQFDEKILRQILTNLLTNAIKYSPSHNLVNFSLTKNNNQILFKISDRGIGIPEADQANLFEPFHRASNVGTIVGTGLGLAIVKKCVDLHQGKINVESRAGEGTTFTVSLPFFKG